MESDFMSGDDERDDKRWELECVVDHENRRGKTWYLVCWKGYRLKEDLWKKPVEFKYAKWLVEEYYERLRQREEFTGKTGCK